MYNNIKSCNFLNGEKSEYFTSLKGVRQGENLSPLLFSLYINDVEKYLLGKDCDPLQFDDEDIDNYFRFRLMVLMYADDIIIMSGSEAALQKALTHMHEYCKKWQLEVNNDNTTITIFSQRKIKGMYIHLHITVLNWKL